MQQTKSKARVRSPRSALLALVEVLVDHHVVRLRRAQRVRPHLVRPVLRVQAHVSQHRLAQPGNLPRGALELLLALQIIGMDDPEEGPMISLDEVDMLRATLAKRLDALLPSEADDGTAPPETREGSVAAYRDGQRRVLRAALEEVDLMLAGAEDGEEGEEEEEDSEQ